MCVECEDVNRRKHTRTDEDGCSNVRDDGETLLAEPVHCSGTKAESDGIDEDGVVQNRLKRLANVHAQNAQKCKRQQRAVLHARR